MAELIAKRLRDPDGRILLQHEGHDLSDRLLSIWARDVSERAEGTPNSPAGILAPSGFEFAAALTGIWAAGRIAVPLQPAHPIEELQYVVQDTGMDLILAHPRELARAHELARVTGARVAEVTLPESRSETIETFSGDGALIIYTSGTTSRPKG
ncbi:MAG TPA: AMP-binding protein, partial [Bdellovibrionales bacterium]|nr:AMP-binding protein [Bdellovibrionales bacterium]